MSNEAIAKELRDAEHLARQFKVNPYAEVKDRLDKLATETAKRSAEEYARKCAQEAKAA